jgi:uracil-DNA glycosylase
MVFDPGPPPAIEDVFARVPDYSAHDDFWIDWGPIFYRGRLSGEARVLCVASDPGATERIAGRTLVGDAGQRVQGFLTKLGLTRSYLCLNAFVYGMFPSHFFNAPDILKEKAQRDWRNELFDKTTHVTSDLQAIIAFGSNAQGAVDLWDGKADVPVFPVHHPSFPNEDELLEDWRGALAQLRGIVTPDADGANDGPGYGSTFGESDYAAIPRRDLPFGAPEFLGDDSWRRLGHPPGKTSVVRPSDDIRHTLVWRAPPSAD